MKVGQSSIKNSNGSIRKFRSKEARAKYEKYAQALKKGWTPKKKGLYE